MRSFAVLAVVLWAAGLAFASSGPSQAESEHTDAQKLAREAAAAQAHDDYRTAAEDYRALISSGYDSPELRSNLGLMLYLADDAKGALVQFLNALSTKPTLVTANLFAGFSYLRLGQAPQAFPYVQKAVQEQPNALAPWLALGRVDVARRDPGSAFAAYKKATEIDPGSAEAWYGRGVTARDVADRMLKHISIADHEHTAASQSPQQNKTREMLEDAERSLSRATSIDPDSTHAHMILGEAFRVSGELDNSVAEYQAILKLKPDFAPAYLGLANTYWKFDRTDEAVSALKKVLSLRPDDPEANGIMAHLLVADQRTQEALPFAERALAKRPDLSFVRVALAKIYLSEGKPQEALPQLEKAVPDDLDGSYHYVLFQTLRKLGRNQEAVAALHESQRLLQGHHS